MGNEKQFEIGDAKRNDCTELRYNLETVYWVTYHMCQSSYKIK